MMDIRRAKERGTISLDWLKGSYTFSFAGYYDPRYMGFEVLRVLNDDHIMPGGGFDAHPHKNMEIISYVLEGALTHKDSMGNGSTIRPGDVQRLSAGEGVVHSEHNLSDVDETHLLQLWFSPASQNIVPSYEQKTFPECDKRGKFLLVASQTGRDGSIRLHQDLDMSTALLKGDEVATYRLGSDRAAWVHLAKGELAMNGRRLFAGDGVGVRHESVLRFAQGAGAEVLIFDMRSTQS